MRKDFNASNLAQGVAYQWLVSVMKQYLNKTIRRVKRKSDVCSLHELLANCFRVGKNISARD